MRIRRRVLRASGKYAGWGWDYWRYEFERPVETEDDRPSSSVLSPIQRGRREMKVTRMAKWRTVGVRQRMVALGGRPGCEGDDSPEIEIRGSARDLSILDAPYWIQPHPAQKSRGPLGRTNSLDECESKRIYTNAAAADGDAKNTDWPARNRAGMPDAPEQNSLLPRGDVNEELVWMHLQRGLLSPSPRPTLRGMIFRRVEIRDFSELDGDRRTLVTEGIAPNAQVGMPLKNPQGLDGDEVRGSKRWGVWPENVVGQLGGKFHFPTPRRSDISRPSPYHLLGSPSSNESNAKKYMLVYTRRPLRGIEASTAAEAQGYTTGESSAGESRGRVYDVSLPSLLLVLRQKTKCSSTPRRSYAPRHRTQEADEDSIRYESSRGKTCGRGDHDHRKEGLGSEGSETGFRAKADFSKDTSGTQSWMTANPWKPEGTPPENVVGQTPQTGPSSTRNFLPPLIHCSAYPLQLHRDEGTRVRGRPALCSVRLRRGRPDLVGRDGGMRRGQGMFWGAIMDGGPVDTFHLHRSAYPLHFPRDEALSKGGARHRVKEHHSRRRQHRAEVDPRAAMWARSGEQRESVASSCAQPMRVATNLSLKGEGFANLADSRSRSCRAEPPPLAPMVAAVASQQRADESGSKSWHDGRPYAKAGRRGPDVETCISLWYPHEGDDDTGARASRIVAGRGGLDVAIFVVAPP
ncbi:hypothetical protein K438DRAFT_1749409 [Mycena galopus ATCC 62051]|nr:hypothetical protein K438DRAFT_1749409 [Mycena galopus ATCC 62051]